MTLAKRVIPCLDVIAGRVMKGVAFVDLRDAGDPAELATRYDQEGADELVFLDITASSDGRAILLDAVRRTADRVFIPLTVGGGIRSIADIDVLLRAGADKVSINTAALDDPSLIERAADRFGCQCVVIAIDARSNRERPRRLFARRSARSGARRHRLGARSRRPRGRRDPADVDGPGRNQERVRPGPDRGCGGRR